MKKSIRITLTFIFLLSVFVIPPLQSARAATEWVVVNTNDSGAGSLRQAIADASNGDTITFAPSLASQKIVLSSPLAIDKDITIDGSLLTSKISISGDNDIPVFFTVSTVTLNGLIITNGNANNMIWYFEHHQQHYHRQHGCRRRWHLQHWTSNDY